MCPVMRAVLKGSFDFVRHNDVFLYVSTHVEIKRQLIIYLLMFLSCVHTLKNFA